MSESNYTVFNAMVDIITSPGKALDAVKSHTSWLWWPLLINLLLACALLYYYYTWVDFDWLIEQTIRQAPPESRAEGADAIRQFMNPATTTWTSIGAVVIVIMIVYLVQAVYLHLANKISTGADVGFGQWFSLGAWSGFVGIFATLATFIGLLMAKNNQVALENLDVFSLNSLLVHASPDDPWYRWATSLRLLTIWSLILMAIGYSRWTGAGMGKSAIIAALPTIAIFGIWALTI